MAKYERTEGVCLRRVDYSNTSQVATFLTLRAGQLPFMCKGIRRSPKRGIGQGMELGARYRLTFFKRRSSNLYTLADHHMLDAYYGTRMALERILCSYYAIELMRNFTVENDPCRRLYHLLGGSLERFERGQALGLSVLFLEIECLRNHGMLPTFDLCAECGEDFPADARLSFSASHAGPLCPACAQGEDSRGASLPVRAQRLISLASLCEYPAEEAGDLSLPPKEIVACSRLLRFHMRYLLGKELKMWKYLHGRHLSRSLRAIRGKG